MINAKELRIGNKVMMSTDGGNEYFIVPIDVGDFMDINCGYKIIKPIPLAEEWLLKFGFTRRLINNAFYEYYIECTPPNYKRSFALCFRFGCRLGTPKGQCDEQSWHAWMSSGDSHNFNIQSIHQLQNLYLALTGEELKSTA